MTDADALIRTESLTLRAICETDVGAIHAALQDWEVVKLLARVPWPYGRADAAEFAARAIDWWRSGEEQTFVIEDGDFAGLIGLRQTNANGDLGYWLARRAWGRGYASEAVAALCDHAFRKSPRTVIRASVATGNPTSVRVLEKCGFGEGRPVVCRTLAQGDLAAVDMRLTRAIWEARQ